MESLRKRRSGYVASTDQRNNGEGSYTRDVERKHTDTDL